MRDKVLKEHSFCFNNQDNGGESLTLTTTYVANGDPISENDGLYVNQELTLQSYCNSVSLNLTNYMFTPERLRQLANQLESARNSIKNEE